MMDSLRWGFIGTGRIAHDFARDLGKVHAAQYIAAVVGQTTESIQAFRKEFNVPHGFTAMEDFLQLPDIDIAYIATPHPLHYEQAMACLVHGIPVLCEKPMTLNAEQAASLVQVSENHHCFLMEAMWIRFLPSIEQLLRLVRKNVIGRIISVKASIGYKAPQDQHNRYFNPELGGGSLLDLGIYTVFLAQLLLGKPDIIKAVGAVTPQGIDASCAILLGYSNGSHALLESTLISQTDTPAEIAGEKGLIRLLNPWFERSAGVELQRYNEDKIIYPCSWPGHGLQYEAAEVLQCLANKKIESSRFTHAFSRQITATMDAIRKQIRVVYRSYE